MKIMVDNREVLDLSEVKRKVLAHDMCGSELDADMDRRVCCAVMKKYESCFKRLKAEWDAKLAANGVTSIPLDQDAYAQLVFSQPNYMDRDARDAESEILSNPPQDPEAPLPQQDEEVAL